MAVERTGRLALLRRLSAGLALAALAGALVTVIVGFLKLPILLPVLVVGLLITVGAGWMFFITRGWRRVVAAVVAVVVLAGLLAFLAVRTLTGMVVFLALVVMSNAAARFAFGYERALVKADKAGRRVPPARHGVLLMNPRSGGAKVTRFNLVDEARRRGIHPVVLAEGDDLRGLAENAIAGGADVLGMAGGDGSQALVADVARSHRVAFVCVPAGTRNHFALDLGLDRNDVVAALDAFGEAVQRPVDLATVGGRVFVNNASLGLYATIVSSDQYRDAKLTTTANLLPDLVGPDTPDFDLRFDGPDGVRRDTADLVLVSNNPYLTRPLDGAGTRPRLDTGQLGVVVVRASRPSDEATRRTPLLPDVEEWTTPVFRVDSAEPIPVGLDGEALRMTPPLEFRILPGALLVRLPRSAPGAAHTAVYGIRGTVTALFQLITNRR